MPAYAVSSLSTMPTGATPYDPWRDVSNNWPNVQVVIEPMAGNLLGELRDDGRLIALRAGTSAAQRRCTLAHELVHLERALFDCGPWSNREESLVHAEVARRLIPLDALRAGIRSLGAVDDLGTLAHVLNVDSETMQLRLTRLDRRERRALRRSMARQSAFWNVA
jgi:hypothetical protein